MPSGGGGVPRTVRPEVLMARRSRRKMELAEVLLWHALRGRNPGSRFRRQHPVGCYVADVFCAERRLVVAVDGEVHGRGDRPARDAERDRFMVDNGYRVLRIGAADILRDMEAVTAAIRAQAASSLHHSAAPSGPPPRAGEE